MRILTKEEVIRRVPEAWVTQYRSSIHFAYYSLSPYSQNLGSIIQVMPGAWDSPEREEQYKKLRDLVDPNEDKIEAIIGNRSWTRLECGVCKQDVDMIVMFPCGEYTLYVCQDCISQARKELYRARTRI